MRDIAKYKRLDRHATRSMTIRSLRRKCAQSQASKQRTPKLDGTSWGQLLSNLFRIFVESLSNHRPYFPGAAFQTQDPGTDPIAFVSEICIIFLYLCIQKTQVESKHTQIESLSNLGRILVESSSNLCSTCVKTLSNMSNLCRNFVGYLELLSNLWRKQNSSWAKKTSIRLHVTEPYRKQRHSFPSQICVHRIPDTLYKPTLMHRCCSEPMRDGLIYSQSRVQLQTYK